MITVADTDLNVTPGTGALIRTFARGAGDLDQYVREARATAKGTLSNIPWTVTTTGLSAVIPADTSRVGLLMVSNANGIVWVRFDATLPTTTAFDWLLNPGDRWEIPVQFTQLAVSLTGAAAGGTILAAAGTCA